MRASNSRHVYHIYAIRTPDRAEVDGCAERKGIQTGIHYPIPVHLLPAYADLGYKAGQFPHSEKAAAEELSLPMYPELTPAMQEEVVAAKPLIELAARTGARELARR